MKRKKLSQVEFDRLFLSLVKCADERGKQVALEVLGVVQERYLVTKAEAEFIKQFFTSKAEGEK